MRGKFKLICITFFCAMLFVSNSHANLKSEEVWEIRHHGEGEWDTRWIHLSGKPGEQEVFKEIHISNGRTYEGRVSLIRNENFFYARRNLYTTSDNEVNYTGTINGDNINGSYTWIQIDSQKASGKGTFVGKIYGKPSCFLGFCW